MSPYQVYRYQVPERHSDAEVAEVGFRSSPRGPGFMATKNMWLGNFCHDQTLKGQYVKLERMIAIHSLR